jgi:hypothetical protein
MARNSRAVKDGNLTTLLVADLFRRQELENPHWPLATRTVPGRHFDSVVGQVCWRRSRQQSSADGQALTAPPIGEKAEVPDAREASREHMFEEAAQEDLVSEHHPTLLVVMSVVLPTERDMGVSEIDEPVVGNGNPMRVAGQIVQNVFGAAERTLRIYHPVFAK